MVFVMELVNIVHQVREKIVQRIKENSYYETMTVSWWRS